MRILTAFCENNEKTMHHTAWSLLYSYLLSSYGLTQDQLSVSRTSNGKPYFSSHPSIHFSIAHSHGLVAVAIGNTPVGIDLERYRPISKRIKTGMLNLPEDAPDDLALSRFTELESYVKYTGGKLYRMQYDDMKKTTEPVCRFIDCSHLVCADYHLTLCLGMESDQTEVLEALSQASALDPP